MKTTFAGERPEAWLNAARHIGKGRGGYLIGHEVAYRFAVEAVATLLRPRFESGELVPWAPSDSRWERASLLNGSMGYGDTPNGQVEAECRRLFITSETAAFVVLTWASPKAKRSAEWVDVMGNDCFMPNAPLDAVAGGAMAHDVFALARRRGWLKAGKRVKA